MKGLIMLFIALTLFIAVCSNDKSSSEKNNNLDNIDKLLKNKKNNDIDQQTQLQFVDVNCKAITIDDNVLLYNKPDTESRIVSKLSKLQKIVVVKRSLNPVNISENQNQHTFYWYKIKHNKKSGWIEGNKILVEYNCYNQIWWKMKEVDKQIDFDNDGKPERLWLGGFCCGENKTSNRTLIIESDKHKPFILFHSGLNNQKGYPIRYSSDKSRDLNRIMIKDIDFDNEKEIVLNIGTTKEEFNKNHIEIYRWRNGHLIPLCFFKTLEEKQNYRMRASYSFSVEEIKVIEFVESFDSTTHSDDSISVLKQETIIYVPEGLKYIKKESYSEHIKGKARMEVEVKALPTEESGSITTLYTDDVVEIINRTKKKGIIWLKVKLFSGESGWIELDKIYFENIILEDFLSYQINN